MSTSFPASLDVLLNPLSGSLLNQPSLDHSDQHTNINDSIEAIQARIGIEGSNDPFSLEHRLTLVEDATGVSSIIQNTALNWSTSNPILSTNQMGVETDTLKIKFGTGGSWNSISYATITPGDFTNSLSDYLLSTDRGAASGVASLDSSGLIPDSEIPATITRDTELSSHASDTTAIHGIADTSLLATQSDISTHNADTTSVHGITDTSLLITTSGGTVQNLTITGNLSVQGTTTTVDTINLDVTDSLIYLASEQFDTDILDIGIFGAYGDNQAGHLHTGLVRDASDGKWKLVSNAAEPTANELDFTAVTYDTLKLGSIEANSASIGDVSNTELQYLNGATSNIQSQIDSKSDSLIQFNQQTSSYTIQLSDKDKIVEMSNGGTLTIPAESTLNLPVGFAVEILQTGSSQVTVAGSGFTPNATPGLKLRSQWSSATLVKRGTDLWIVSGDLSA